MKSNQQQHYAIPTAYGSGMPPNSFGGGMVGA